MDLCGYGPSMVHMPFLLILLLQGDSCESQASLGEPGQSPPLISLCDLLLAWSWTSLWGLPCTPRVALTLPAPPLNAAQQPC